MKNTCLKEAIHNESHMDCDVIKAEMQDFFDDELTREEERRFTRHLETCPKCAHEASVYQLTIKILKQMPDIEPSNQYWDKVSKQVIKKLSSK